MIHDLFLSAKGEASTSVTGMLSEPDGTLNSGSYILNLYIDQIIEIGRPLVDRRIVIG